MSVCNKKQIQSTNDNSTVSKLSSARKKYFKDDFLQFFVSKPQIRSPLINRGYYIRFKAMEAVMEAWINILTMLEIEKCQIISLGAGFDSTYFRLKSQEKLPKLCKYIEVDFSEVLVRKLSSIQFHKELQALIQDNFNNRESSSSSLFLSTSNYTLLAADLNDPENLHSLLVETGINFNSPTLFLAECSITYMDVHRSNNLIKWAKDNFPNSLFITYEQVYPNDGFGLIMKKHFSAMGSPLKSIDVYTDLVSQRNRFLFMGWTCGVIGMNEFYSTLPVDETIRIQDLELFDEYESWHQKCSHYSLTWASQGFIPLNSSFDGMSVGPNYFECNHLCKFTVEDACSCFLRFGHQICCMENGNLLITGGFGVLKGKHQKLRGVIFYSIETMEMQEINIDDEENKLGERMFHAMVQLKDGILIIGGRSAPSYPYKHSVMLYPNNEPSVDTKYENNCKNAQVCDSSSEIEMGKMKFKCQVTTDVGNVPHSRWRHTVLALEISGKEMVFLFAGSTADQKATNDCYLLDTVTWIWSKVSLQASTPTERHSHSSAVLGTTVFVSGGLSQTEKPMKSVYRFEADTLTWFKLDLNGTLLPRYSHTSHIWRNRLILVGGVSAIPGHDPFLAVINLITLHVIEFLMPGQLPEYPILLWNHGSIIHKDQVITFGGGGNCFSFGTHFNLKLLKIDLNSIPCK